MSLYLYQNDKQTGPFTEAQLRQMLQGGLVPMDVLTWKEGMAGWEPLRSVISIEGNTLPPRPPKKTSVLALISLIFSLVSVLGWIILLTVAGVAQNQGNVSQGFNIIVGLFLIGGLILNFFALITGIIAAVQNEGRTVGILGACFNALIIAGLVGLMVLGLAMQHAHQQP